VAAEAPEALLGVRAGPLSLTMVEVEEDRLKVLASGAKWVSFNSGRRSGGALEDGGGSSYSW
jgi:hypothetical protein